MSFDYNCDGAGTYDLPGPTTCGEELGDCPDFIYVEATCGQFSQRQACAFAVACLDSGDPEEVVAGCH